MITFDYPDFYQNDERFIPEVFDGDCEESVPAGFNAARIALDGGLYSDLKWDSAFCYAKNLAKQGLKILWDLDLGLFTRLRYPLSDQVQFQTLTIAVQHLLTLIKQDFVSSTIGVILYRGPLQDLHLNYLHSLRAGWPDAVQPMLLLDASQMSSPLQQLLVTRRDRTCPFVLAISGSRLPGRTLGWEWGSPFGYIAKKRLPLESTPEPKLGICLPSADLHPNDQVIFEEVVQNLLTTKTPFRVVTEEFLTVEWDELDTILLPPSGLTEEGMRKLKGFSAAGGFIGYFHNFVRNRPAAERIY